MSYNWLLSLLLGGRAYRKFKSQLRYITLSIISPLITDSWNRSKSIRLNPWCLLGREGLRCIERASGGSQFLRVTITSSDVVLPQEAERFRNRLESHAWTVAYE